MKTSLCAWADIHGEIPAGMGNFFFVVADMEGRKKGLRTLL